MTSGNGNDPGRHVMRAASARTPDCVPIERLGEALTEAEQIHVASCARCQTEIVLRSEFDRAVTTDDERLPVEWIAADLRRRHGARKSSPGGGWRGTTRPLLALAAGIVLVASVGYIVWDREPTLREPGLGAPVERGRSIGALAPTGDVQGAPDVFSWAAVEGAATYELSVMEVDRTVLWRESSSVPRVTPPAILAARLVPGKTVLWKVMARNAAGSVIAESAVVSLRVATVPRGDAHGP